MRKLLLVVVLPVLVFPVILTAGVFDTMNYQGVLTDSEGTKITGLKTITFSIWDAQAEGGKFWEEMHTLYVADGVFSVMLGETEPLSDLSGIEQYWLQIQVSGDVAMQRIKLTAVPYAMNSRQLQGYEPGNTTLDIPISNGTICTNLNADKLDGFSAGNEAGQLPINNGTVNATLNADKVDGFDAADFALDGHTHAAATINDEPGVAGDGDTNSVTITTSFTTLASRTLTAPVAGYALVIGTAEFSLANDDDAAATLTVGVTKTAAAFLPDADPQWVLADEVADYGGKQIITVQRLFSVNSGSNDFYFQAFTGDANDDAAAKNRYLSIIFFPTGYGLVE